MYSLVLNHSKQKLCQILPTTVSTFRYKSLTRPSFTMDKSTSGCKVDALDHFVLTVADIEKSIKFYTKGLGMTLITFGEGRKAVQFGNQKINLHQAGREFKPYARKPTPGSADVCFVSNEPLSSWVSQLKQSGISVEEGPIKRTGAIGPITSIYVRDPDGNLVEISNY